MAAILCVAVASNKSDHANVDGQLKIVIDLGIEVVAALVTMPGGWRQQRR